MIISIDRLSQRYGVLPSRLMREGDSFDFMVCDTAMTWEAEQQRRASGEKPDYNKTYSQESLQAMLDRARSKQ